MERLLTSVPDILLAGGGAFLLFKNRKLRWLGGPLILLYLLSAYGAYTGEAAQNMSANNQADQIIHYSIGGTSLIVGGLLGFKSRKKKQ